MKLTSAKKVHFCNGCNKNIEVDEKYWSTSYKCLCMECYIAKNQDNSQRFVIGDPCSYCGKPAGGQWGGVAVCLTHLGDAVANSQKDTSQQSVEQPKGENE